MISSKTKSRPTFDSVDHYGGFHPIRRNMHPRVYCFSAISCFGISFFLLCVFVGKSSVVVGLVVVGVVAKTREKEVLLLLLLS